MNNDYLKNFMLSNHTRQTRNPNSFWVFSNVNANKFKNNSLSISSLSSKKAAVSSGKGAVTMSHGKLKSLNKIRPTDYFENYDIVELSESDHMSPTRGKHTNVTSIAEMKKKRVQTSMESMRKECQTREKSITDTSDIMIRNTFHCQRSSQQSSTKYNSKNAFYHISSKEKMGQTSQMSSKNWDNLQYKHNFQDEYLVFPNI